MGKHGPCYHCGVTSTPLWRNGPPEKPVLCNACGSRWRTKGTLANYTPLHARAEHDEIEAGFPPKLRILSTNRKEERVLKRKLSNDLGEFGIPHLESGHGVHKVFDEDTSNRSSSGSAISNNESFVQYGSADASDLTGPSQAPSMWESTVPSRKRTCFARPKQSHVEKLTKDLYSIWHQQQSSCFSGSSEEDLLLQTDKPMVSVEIGHGSVLIRHPSSFTREEESEASSLSFDNKHLNPRTMTCLSDFIEDSGAKGSSNGIQQFNKSPGHASVLRSARGSEEKFQILANRASPLRLIDLQDILNYEKFCCQLSKDEQQKLLKFLPTVDTVGTPDSLKMMFASRQFRENLLFFQKLLGDGFFDGSALGVLAEDSRNLQKLILGDQRISKWVEKYTDLKDPKGKTSNQGDILGKFNGFEPVGPMSTSRARDGHHKKLAGPNFIMSKMPIAEDVELIEYDGSLSCTTKGLFSLQNDDICSISDLNADGCYEQDLLIDVPSNIYPEAELLIPTSGMASSSSSSAFQACFLRPR